MTNTTTQSKSKERHGGPSDRGAADAYYGRPLEPHYFISDTYSSPKVTEADMTPEELQQYKLAYETQTDFKYC